MTLATFSNPHRVSQREIFHPIGVHCGLGLRHKITTEEKHDMSPYSSFGSIQVSGGQVIGITQWVELEDERLAQQFTIVITWRPED